jgi:hypothetical protein
MNAHLNVNDMKLKQYLLIAKAGLAVGESREKAKSTILNDIMKEFVLAVEKFNVPASFGNFDRQVMLRTKNFSVPLNRLDASDLHTGASLWRKFKEIRLVVMNDLANMLAKKLPGGQPPSGKSMDEILLAVRQEAHTLNQDEAQKKSKAKGGYTRHVFLETWYPAEWEVLMVYGAASPNPEEAFDCKYENSPVSGNLS